MIKHSLILASLLIPAYSYPELPHAPEQTKEKDGMVYDLQSDEPFNGKIIQDGDKDQGFLYLIYGHPYSYKVMEYVDGMLDDVTHYDEGNNQVLCEDYKEGELVFQWSCLGCQQQRLVVSVLALISVILLGTFGGLRGRQ